MGGPLPRYPRPGRNTEIRPSTPLEERVSRLRDAAAEVVVAHRLPGLGVGLVGPEGNHLLETWGLADIESGAALEPSHRQRIGSITKTMVGLCTLALVEQKKLSLGDPVRDHLPEVGFEGPVEALTIRHLLTHTGGIGEAPTLEHLQDPEAVLWADAADEVLPVPEQYPNGVLVEVPPGTKWAYANHGWALLGEIVAGAEGRPIEDVVRKRIFEPLGMQHADMEDQPHADLSTGYHRAPGDDLRELLRRAGREVPEEETVDGTNIRGRYRWVRGRAAGAVQASLPDLSRYAQALLRRGEGIVAPETFDRMLEPQWCPDPRLTHMGLAFFREPFFGRLSFGHNGGIVGGWNTALKVFPKEGLAIVIHLNLAYDGFDAVERRLIQAALGADDATSPSVPLDDHVRDAAPGVFEATPGALTNVRISAATGRIQISADGDGLRLHSRRGAWKQGVRLRPADPDDPLFFEVETPGPEPARLAFVAREDRITGLRFDRLVQMVRNESVEPWA